MSDTWDEVTLFPCFVHSLSECMLKLLSKVEAQMFWTLLKIPHLKTISSGNNILSHVV
jgi:hypothetical protein